MTKQTTVRVPDELAAEAEAVARVKGTSINALIIDSLAAEIERVRADKDFTARARKLLERDKELLDRPVDPVPQSCGVPLAGRADDRRRGTPRRGEEDPGGPRRVAPRGRVAPKRLDLGNPQPGPERAVSSAAARS